MSVARFIVGDVLDVMRAMPDASVDLVLTSSPFLALRSYLPAGHANKGREVGSEATPGQFIDVLLTIAEEARRVLAPHGSMVWELGDTYAGSGGAGGDYNAKGLRDGQERFDGSASKAFGTGAAPRPARDRWRSPGADPLYAQRGEQTQGTGAGGAWPLDKSLCMVPELFRVALAYGVNPLTGRATERWRVRNVVRWCRPNPPVGALADKVRPATSDLVVACTSRKRYFDLEAVRGPGSQNTHARTARGVEARPNSGKSADDEQRGGNYSTLDVIHDTDGAPPLDHWWFDEDEGDVFGQDAWRISTQPYKGAHYATWPAELCVLPIDAMCPRKVCTTCGEPSRRIVETTRALDGEAADLPAMGDAERAGATANSVGHWRLGTDRSLIGWTCCGHGDGCRPTTWARVLTPVVDEETGEPTFTKAGRPKMKATRVVGDVGHCRAGHWRNGVVIDPFAGSGTTLAVATGMGRDAIGIDLDERNAELARRRVGMFLEVETAEMRARATT